MTDTHDQHEASRHAWKPRMATARGADQRRRFTRRARGATRSARQPRPIRSRSSPAESRSDWRRARCCPRPKRETELLGPVGRRLTDAAVGSRYEAAKDAATAPS